MRSVLGIDAAWTDRNPSGVALIAETAERWRCVAVAPSYHAFLALADGTPVDWSARHRGTPPDIQALSAACQSLIGRAPDVVAIDMPLSLLPISGYRAADRALSEVFSSFDCSVLPPSAAMPGAMSDRLRAACGEMGWRLATQPHLADGPALLEVYPHAAIVRLMRLAKRLTYKVGRSAGYGRRESPPPDKAERARRLLVNFAALATALTRDLDDITLPLPAPDATVSFSRLKTYEDALDALVCAWVGAQFLAGKAEAFGDPTAAIWVPTAAL